MRDSRLTQAVETGAAPLPEEGRIAVFRPGAGADLSALPRARLHILHGFKPDFDAWAGRGYRCDTAPEGEYAAAVVFVPRAKALARDLIARALAATGGGPVIVDGQKTDGIDGLLRECRKRGRVSAPLAGGHGKLFVLDAAPGDFADWQGAPAVGPGGFVTAPGAFSADAVDRGSALLAAALPARLRGRAADLGAGWGYLAAAVLTRPEITEMHLIEAERAALDCARVNITDPRARFHWADATSFAPEAPFDLIVTNPPFHSGRAAEPALGRAFIAAAARMLTPGGTLWLVANRHLPYERDLAALFAEVAEQGEDPGFKLLRASRPRRPRRN